MKRAWILLLALILLAGMTAAVQAQIGSGYDMTWWTVDSGGSMNLSGGAYSHSATIGQPDAAAASGAGYTLVGGFWGVEGYSAPPRPFKIYLPLTLR